jgi:SAM-dependent methyltransferase
LKPFELLYLLGEPFLQYHLVRARRDLKVLIRKYPPPVRLLDVGARKSHYTIGLKADVVLLDLSRTTEVQHSLNLGATNELLAQIQKRRSNVRDYIVEDFLNTSLTDESFDIVVAIEVIEHVREDECFMRQAARVLKAGGSLYLRTPNGATISNRNPDHVRHYTAGELETLLSRSFPRVEVEHGEVVSRHRTLGMGFWAPRRPLRLMRGVVANVTNRLENKKITPTASNTARLFAVAQKD